MEKRKRKNDDPESGGGKPPLWVLFGLIFAGIIVLAVAIPLAHENDIVHWLNPADCSLIGIKLGDMAYLTENEAKAAGPKSATDFNNSISNQGVYVFTSGGLIIFQGYKVNAFFDDKGLTTKVTIDSLGQMPSWAELLRQLGDPLDLQSVKPDPKSGNEVYHWLGYSAARNALQPDVITWLEIEPTCKAAQ